MLPGLMRFISESSRTLLGLVAVVLVTVSAVLLLVMLAVELTGGHLSPYAGIVTYMILPALFVLGLVLVAVARLRARGALRRGEILRGTLDFNDPRDRQRVYLVGGLTAVNLFILGLTAYHGVHYMDSTSFCGKVCHEVMEPEYTAYQNSPHSRVACTSCHIGPGASWFVKSKLSGTRQVFAVALRTFPRPIPAPIHDLRPARETCEQCHWPSKFTGDRIKVLTRYQEDEANTELKTVLLLKVGGGSLQSGFATGIHWHMSPSTRIDYRASEDRRSIPWVRVQEGEGEAREYWAAGAAGQRDSILALPVRRMDCIDCHNRPTHAYQLPDDALDAALHGGQVPAGLPFVKREGMRLLQAAWPNKEAALGAFDDSLRAFYARLDPQLLAARGSEVDAAAAALQAIYARNVFPHMNVGWGTYGSFVGHRDDSGCFRCHDESHATESGETIRQDCSTCHNLLADGETTPAVLQALYEPR
jgi:hypothetical protein